jgi:hypothetical protein
MSLRARFQIFLSNVLWGLGTLTMVVPCYIGSNKPLIKIFGESATEAEILDFLNDESALSYVGIEINSTKTFTSSVSDSIWNCIWFKSINTIKSKNLIFKSLRSLPIMKSLKSVVINSKTGKLHFLYIWSF